MDKLSLNHILEDAVSSERLDDEALFCLLEEKGDMRGIFSGQIFFLVSPARISAAVPGIEPTPASASLDMTCS